LSAFSSVDINTLKSYLEILEQTFIIKQVKPFYTNKTKEIVKMPKIYFLDN
jgi:predicted AAA+ superfamily ATPase